MARTEQPAGVDPRFTASADECRDVRAQLFRRLCAEAAAGADDVELRPWRSMVELADRLYFEARDRG